VRIHGPGMAPCYDPISHLAYAAGRENVTHVWVNGRILVREQQLTSINAADLYKNTHLWHNKLLAETKA